MNDAVIQAITGLALAADAAGGGGGPTTNTIPPVLFEVFGAFFAILGTLLSLLAAIGLMRFPDVYTRMQASAKAGTLGVACLVLAVPAHFASAGVFAEAVLVIAFFFLTAPVASHLVGRAAYMANNPIWARTAFDDLRGCYDHDTHVLHPSEEPVESPASNEDSAAGASTTPPRSAAG